MPHILDRALQAFEKAGSVSTNTAFGSSTFKPVIDRQLLESQGFAPITLDGQMVGYSFFDGYTFDQFVIDPQQSPENLQSLDGLVEVMTSFESNRYEMKAIVPLSQLDIDTTDASLGRFISSRLLTYGYTIEGLDNNNVKDGMLVLVDIVTDTPYVVSFVVLPGLVVIMHDKEAQSLITAA